MWLTCHWQKARDENEERQRRRQLEADLLSVESHLRSSSSSIAAESDLNTVTASETSLSEKLRECCEARDRRVATFLDFLRRRRDNQIATILASRQSLST